MTTTQPQTTLDLFDDNMDVREDIAFFDPQGRLLGIPFTVVSRAIDLGMVKCPSCAGVLDHTYDDNELLRCAHCGYMLEG